MKKSPASTPVRVALLSLFFAGTLPAATITWTGPFDVTSVSDISTAGTAVYAYNYGVTTSYTLNGVTFTGNNAGGGTDSACTAANWGTGTYSAYSAPAAISGTDYASALSTGRYTLSNSNPTVTFDGLTPGNSYQLQIWFCDMRAGNDYMDIFSGGTLLSGPSIRLMTGPGVAQYALGSFQADDTAQLINLKVTTAAVGPTINLLQLRDISPIPEPSTYGLAGAGALAALVAMRRRRR